MFTLVDFTVCENVQVLANLSLRQANCRCSPVVSVFLLFVAVEYTLNKDGGKYNDQIEAIVTHFGYHLIGNEPWPRKGHKLAY